MAQLSQTMVTALFELALTSEADADARLKYLMSYAEACDAAGHADACAEALGEALRILAAVAELPDAGSTEIATRARAIAALAARLGRPDLATDARMLEAPPLWRGAGREPRPSSALLEAGRVERRAGELEAARENFSDALEAEETSDAPDLLAIGQALHELGLVENELQNAGEATDILCDAVRRLGDELADDHPLMTSLLESLASIAAEAGRPATVKVALEWRLAATGATDASDDPARSILDRLGPIVEQVADDDEGGGQIMGPERAWAFDLRRRALDGEDLRPRLERDLPQLADAFDTDKLWSDEEPGDEPVADRIRKHWDERDAELGTELLRALERYLLIQVVDQTARGADAADPARLRHTVTESFFAMLFNVEVEVQE